MIYAKNGEVLTEKTLKKHQYQADDVVEVTKYGRLLARGIVLKSVGNTITVYTNTKELLTLTPRPEKRIGEIDTVVSHENVNGMPGEYQATTKNDEDLIKNTVFDSGIFNVHSQKRMDNLPMLTIEQNLQLITFHDKLYDDGTTVFEWRKESTRKQRELSMRNSFWKTFGRELNELWVGDVIVSRGGRTHLLHAGDLIWAKSELEREEIVAIYPANKRMEVGLMNQGLRIGLDD